MMARKKSKSQQESKSLTDERLVKLVQQSVKRGESRTGLLHALRNSGFAVGQPRLWRMFDEAVRPRRGRRQVA